MIGYFIDLVYFILVIYYANKDVEKATKFLIGACFFQNIILCVASPYMSVSAFSIFILLKEVFALIYIVIQFYKNRYKLKYFQCFCAMVIILLIILTFVAGYGTLKTRLSCMRQLYLPFVFYLFGSVSKINIDKIKNVLRFYIKLSVITSLFGFVEILLGNKLWVALKIENYCVNKGILSISNFYNGLPGNFYSFDIPVLVCVQRMGSLFVDPVICGQVLSFAFILAFFEKSLIKTRYRRYLVSTVLGIGLVLTLCKGGIIIASFSLCILLGKVFKKRILSNLMLGMGVLVIGGYLAFSLTNGLSAATHMNGLITGVQSLFEHPLGTGIGSAGNLSVEEGKAVNMAGAESYVGSLMAQIGVIGLFFNIYYFVHILKYNKIRKENKHIYSIIFTANLALGITSLVNFTAISFTCCFMFIISTAMLHNLIRVVSESP